MQEERKVRLNWLAVLVSALVYFAVDAVWFSVLLKEWLAGNRLTLDQLQELGKQGYGQLVAYLVAFVGALVIAVVIAWLTQISGRQTIVRGVMIAIVCWVGFVLTTFAMEQFFEARTIQSLLINTGASLIGMVLAGAIMGGWKAKSKALNVTV